MAKKRSLRSDAIAILMYLIMYFQNFPTSDVPNSADPVIARIRIQLNYTQNGLIRDTTYKGH